MSVVHGLYPSFVFGRLESGEGALEIGFPQSALGEIETALFSSSALNFGSHGTDKFPQYAVHI